MASDVTKVCVEARLFLHHVAVAGAIDPSEHPPWMLHDLCWIPLRLLFVPLFLRTNIFKGNLVFQKAHRIVKYLKIKTDESEYRTQGN